MKYKLNIYLITYIILGITGVALIGLGVSVKSNDLFSNLFISFGGVTLGTSITMIIESLRLKEQDEKIIKIIKNSITSKITSDEDSIKDFRRKFYCYYNTEGEDEKIFWNHLLLDFTKFNGIGKLESKVEILNSSGERFTYFYEGIRRNVGEPLVLFDRSENGNEPTSVHVFPKIRDYLNKHFGYSYLETWTGKAMLGKIILSESVLFEIDKPGRIEEVEIAKKLDNEWEKKFIHSFVVFPNVKNN